MNRDPALSTVTRIRIGLLTASLALLAINCGLTEMLQPATTTPVEQQEATSTWTSTATSPQNLKTPSPTATPQTETAATNTPEPTLQSTAPETPTNTPLPPIDTSTPEPTPTTAPSQTPEPTATAPGLRIESFQVQLEHTSDGKLVHCAWETSGADSVRLVLTTAHRFPPTVEGPADGDTTFEMATTIYADPEVILTAFGPGSAEATQTITLEWPCANPYFFGLNGTEVPRICPSTAHITRQGAQQAFQGGTMFWLPDVDDVNGMNVIFVIYNSGDWNMYKDTWEEGQPESDPTIIPPSDLYQPIRGFGKVWRTNSDVRDNLDWATTGEASVVIQHQRQMQESLGGVQYLRTAGGQLLRLNGLGGSGSTWTIGP